MKWEVCPCVLTWEVCADMGGMCGEVFLLLLWSPGKCVHADMAEAWEMRCDNLLMCFVTILTRGVPAGGGVGDILRKVSSSVSSMEGNVWCSPFILGLGGEKGEIDIDLEQERGRGVGGHIHCGVCVCV